MAFGILAALAPAALAQQPAGLDEVLRLLASRDPVGCAQIEGATPTPVETLRHVVDQVSMPPWAPMRAADCLTRNHAVAVREDLARWVTDPELKGLGRLALGALDAMPVEVAVVVVDAALKGSDPALAATRAAKATAPEVRARVVASAPTP